MSNAEVRRTERQVIKDTKKMGNTVKEATKRARRPAQRWTAGRFRGPRPGQPKAPRRINQAARGRRRAALGARRLPPVLQCYADAVINPFSDGAIGAIVPDAWHPPTIPAMDRLSIVLDPSDYIAFFDIGSTIAIIVSFMPRSLSTGWLTSVLEDQNKKLRGTLRHARAPKLNQGTHQVKLISGTPEQISFEDFKGYKGGRSIIPETADCKSQAVDASCLHLGDPIIYTTTIPFTSFSSSNNTLADVPGTAEPYVLFYAVIGSIDGAPAYARRTLAGIAPGYNTISFARIDSLVESASACRIVGAGLKIYANAPPLTTGGTCYGGWIAGNDLFDSFLTGTGVANTLGPSPFTIQDSLRQRVTNQGVDGVTVRYSAIQSPVQEEFRNIDLPQTCIQYDEDDGLNSVILAAGFNVQSYDIASPSDFIPAVVWSYENAANTYALRIEARVHLQCIPLGDNPYLIEIPPIEPGLKLLQCALSNPMITPAATTGHSFKSVMTKMGAILNHMTSYALKAGAVAGIAGKAAIAMAGV